LLGVNYKLISYLGSIISIIAIFTPALFRSDSSHYVFIWMIGFFLQLYPSEINIGPIREFISLSMGYLVLLILVIFMMIVIRRTIMNHKVSSGWLLIGILENFLIWSYYIGINFYTNYYRWTFGESYAFILYLPGPAVIFPSLVGVLFIIAHFLTKIKQFDLINK
jgi:hypothetical protein